MAISKQVINESLDNMQKANLIKDALKIVDELATLDIHDDRDEVDELIDKAIKLKRHRLWKLE
jgi:hypothetical protein